MVRFRILATLRLAWRKTLDYIQDVVLRVTVKGTLEVPSRMSKDELEEWLSTDTGKAALSRMDVEVWDEVATIFTSKKATNIG